MPDIERCLIWDTPASTVKTSKGNDRIVVESVRTGGRYSITRQARLDLDQLGDREKARLTTWLVNQRSKNIDVPEITSSVISKIQGESDLSIGERMLRLIEYIRVKTIRFGELVKIKYNRKQKGGLEIYAYTESLLESEIISLIRNARRSGAFTKCAPHRFHALIELSANYYDTIVIEEHDNKKKQVFIAMWFNDIMEEAYIEGIKNAVENSGYRAVRIDREYFTDKIDDKILEEINKSAFIVADFTQNENQARGGVYYEAGYACGRDIPVIFTCRQDCLRYLHFDTRQYPHIPWSNPQDLRIKLEARISALYPSRRRRAK